MKQAHPSGFPELLRMQQYPGSSPVVFGHGRRHELPGEDPGSSVLTHASSGEPEGAVVFELQEREVKEARPEKIRSSATPIHASSR
jgi:hypothetical protein